MALNGAGLSAEIQAALTPWNGVQLAPFCNALGNGIVLSLSGILQFSTADAGTIPGTGAGSGTGIIGMSPANVQGLIFSTGQGFWASGQNNGPGVEWMTFCQKIAAAVVTHLQANATLTSTHAPVFAGVGTVVAYTGITPTAMQSSIVGQAPGSWAAWRFPELALAVATGVVTEILSHSPGSTVTIVGSPSGAPVGGAGSGTGIVT